MMCVDRVCSKLGRYPVHGGALNVTASNGIVTLSGNALADELPKILRAVRLVRGVKGIDNRLDLHEEAGATPSLQGTAHAATV